ncbi:hypothetical protein GPECTOR_13g819 [Gonium pectorale]|uniref:Uncharacterized protein n=1 Tax=Gonium pectorale TaxID=33097 RepID=A0A150GNM2_GONPE|nr:hypothetical protein GPECTOR_13g819 [Gonium pectorale]|eukprot:KXZ51332.1 hypothetical protein GPECTOR_13g819 [Gonium pectorale]
MSATFFLHQVQSFFVFLKLCWYLIPVVYEGRRPEAFAYVLLVFLVAGNIAFYAGRPRGRCILPLMKVAALLVMGTLGMSFVGLWKYHMLDPKTHHYSRRLYRVLRDEGRVTSPAWLDAFTTAETALDLAVVATVGYCFFTFNNWVRDAMEAVKQREARSSQAPSGSRAAAAAPSGPARKRR